MLGLRKQGCPSSTGCAVHSFLPPQTPRLRFCGGKSCVGQSAAYALAIESRETP